ncbi:tetratricopeptide repeat protein [Dokdonella sp.]|uniref:tetratricopeptide repeat protein n=1 Tax=Dokdonella sp. TaxID=2291710 RepID=UPI0025C24968|nr:tetratricopeptide repeat protein [Dokdonella sp.]MBX3691585.1 tetratricopeptide repeat protein [Dokdonella sp.]
MKHRLLSALVVLALSGGIAFAQTYTPLPQPDLSKLDAAEIAQLREARANFDKAIVGKSGVALAELYGDIGAAYARARLIDATRVAIDNAAIAAPLDDRWPYLQGALARMQGKHEVARAAFEKSLKLNGMYLPTRIALAGELLRIDDVDGAGKLLAAALADHEREPALRAMLADVAYRKQHYKEAVAYLEEALRLDPRATALYGALARAHEAAGDTKAAREAQGKIGDVPPFLRDPLLARLLPAPVISNLAATAASPARVPAEQSTSDPREAAIGEAHFLAANGKYAEARGVLDKALTKQANDVALLSTYARIEAADGRVEAAKARATAATRAAPKSVLAWLTQGFIAEVAGDDAGARNAYERATVADPKAPRPQVALGNLALRSGRAADAIAAYRAATTIQPDDAENWAHLLAAEFIAGQCSTGLREAADNARKHARDPLFADLHIRAVSTCPAATPEQKKAVLGQAEALYRQAPEKNLAQVAETYALALAANGRWDEAAETQGSAIYEAATLGDKVATAQYRELFQRFQAKQMPTRPWAESHPLLKPPRPSVPPKPAVAAPPRKP